jgi:hypothetical protein
VKKFKKKGQITPKFLFYVAEIYNKKRGGIFHEKVSGFSYDVSSCPNKQFYGLCKGE